MDLDPFAEAKRAPNLRSLSLALFLLNQLFLCFQTPTTFSSRIMFVAVIGMGTLGLTALNSMLEAGLDAVGFEIGGEVGEIWDANPNETVTSALPETSANWFKHRVCASSLPCFSHH